MVVGVGRLEEQKNFFLLIRAFKQLIHSYPDYKLVIYGEGNLRSELEGYASKKLPNDSFHFPGNNADLLNSIKDAEMFVLSSNYEGFPNVLIEAMAIGMPVISTDCPSGGPTELIRNGENGYLVPVNDDLAMFNSMLKIVQNSEYSTQMGKNATLVKEKYEAQAISELWLQYLIGVSGVHSVEKR
jgi:glycosyltransferase involved in cell wall biosynthesis